jgi:hypothetical protein
MKIHDLLIFRLIWHLEGFGSMENTPTGCGNDLPTSLRILVNNFLECSDLDPNSRKDLFYQPELRLVMKVSLLGTTNSVHLGTFRSNGFAKELFISALFQALLPLGVAALIRVASPTKACTARSYRFGKSLSSTKRYTQLCSNSL